MRGGAMPFVTSTVRTHSCRILFLLLAAAMSVPGKSSAGADLTEMSLEALMNVTIVGASRYEQKSSEAPSFATVLTAEDIRRNGYRNLSDLLRSVPDVLITRDRNYDYIGFRGFSQPGDYNTRVLLLVDGHRINNNIYDQALIGNEFPIDIDLVERVEVIRGPSSSLYGSNAFFGIVNIITKDGGNIEGTEISGSAGSYRTFGGRATVGRKSLDGPGIILSGTVSRGRGQDLFFPEFNDPAANNGISVDADSESFRNAFAKLSWGDFTLEGVTGQRKKRIPTGSYDTTFNDNRTYTDDRLNYLDLRYERDISGGLNVVGRAFYDDYRYRGDYIYAPVVNKDFGSGRLWGTELKIVKKVRDRHRLTFGAEYRDNFRQDQGNYDAGAPAPNLDDRKRSYVWAAYFQDEFRITSNLILNAGFRYDYYSTVGGSTNPRIGLIFRPTEKTSAKLLYGRAFRAPNLYELNYDNGISWKSNPDLRSETIRTHEAILERYVDGPGVAWKGTAAAFHYSIDDLITAQADPAGGPPSFRNNESIRTNGVTLELNGKTPGGFEGRAGCTWQRSKAHGAATALSNSPRNIAKVNLVLPLRHGKISLSPEVQFVSRRRTVPGKVNESVAGYSVVNATLLARPLPRLELSASAYNLLDKRYADPAGPEHLQDSIPQDGRNYRMKATFRF